MYVMSQVIIIIPFVYACKIFLIIIMHTCSIFFISNCDRDRAFDRTYNYKFESKRRLSDRYTGITITRRQRSP